VFGCVDLRFADAIISQQRLDRSPTRMPATETMRRTVPAKEKRDSPAAIISKSQRSQCPRYFAGDDPALTCSGLKLNPLFIAAKPITTRGPTHLCGGFALGATTGAWRWSRRGSRGTRMGKSRLAREILWQAHNLDTRTLVGRRFEQQRTVPRRLSIDAAEHPRSQGSTRGDRRSQPGPLDIGR
jgi:hypothetical protein